MMSTCLVACLCLLLLGTEIREIECHGRLMEPPSRSSMHRVMEDPDVKPYSNRIVPNFNDMGLNCGGRSSQIANGGKCGVCGDPYQASQPRENEAGGRYAQGFVTRTYQRGAIIPVAVELTAPHRGYFEFRICPWNNFNKVVTHACLDQHLLSYSNGETRFYVPVSGAVGMHNMKVRLPSDITCQQCVLQWRYRTGNSWGTENGESGLGLGQQEEFYGCADVAILDGLSPNGMSTTATSRSTSVSQVWSTTKWTQPPTPHWTTTQTTTTQTPQTTTDIPPNPIPASQVPDCKYSPPMVPLPVLNECDKFYQCWNQHLPPYKMRCGPGTVYNPEIQRCDHKYNVALPCGTRPW